VRALLNVKDLDPVTEGRPAAELALRYLPKFGTDFPAGLLPAKWLGPIRASARS
jgi:hypothetical protein